MMILSKMGGMKAFLLAGLIGLAVSACDNPVQPDPHTHSEARGVVITDRDNNVIADTHGSHWHYASGSSLHLHPGESLDVRIWFVDDAGDRFQISPSDSEYALVVEVEDSSVVAYEEHGNHGHIEALDEGDTTMIVHLWHGLLPGGHADYSSPPLAIEVVSHEH